MSQWATQRSGESLLIVETPEDVGKAAADIVFAAMSKARELGNACVVGCPGGRSPITTYGALSDLVRQSHMPLDHVVIAMMDEYLISGAGGALVNVDPGQHFSCAGFAQAHIVNQLNAAAPAGRGIRPDNLWVPQASNPAAYEKLLRDSGVDVFLLAVGASDGHIAFNPAGTDAHAETRVTELAELTRQDNMHTFPGFASLDDVPLFGVSVGPGTIRDVSRQAVMVVHGEHKALAVQRLMAATSYESSWPATVVWECQQPLVIADASAASLL